MKNGGSQVYGTFSIGPSEFAVEVEAVTEVVNFPALVSPVPMAPSFVIGFFNLRGVVVPILDLGILLRTHTESSGRGKVAVLEVSGLKVGITFETTKDIVRVKRSDILDYEYAEGSPQKVLKGALKLEKGERLIHLLYLPGIVQIENLPYVIEAQQKEHKQLQTKTLAESQRKQAVSFKVGPHLLALNLECITEIASLPEVERTALQNEVCTGRIKFRDDVLPVVNLAKLLGEADSPMGIADSFDEQKLLVLKFANGPVGFIVDTLEGIVTYAKSDVKAVPVFSRDRKGFLSGCLSQSEGADILILDQNQMLKDEELNAITGGHTQLYAAKDTPRDKVTAKTTGFDRYITFTLAYPAAIKMLEIREIVSLPEQLMKSPGSRPWLKGLMNLRGDLVSIIDLRKLYGLPEALEEQAWQILVVKGQNEIYGLLVDSVDSTVNINHSKKMQIPASFYPPVGEAMLSDLKEFIDPYGHFPIQEKLMIFDLESLLRRISGAKSVSTTSDIAKLKAA